MHAKQRLHRPAELLRVNVHVLSQLLVYTHTQTGSHEATGFIVHSTEWGLERGPGSLSRAPPSIGTRVFVPENF